LLTQLWPMGAGLIGFGVATASPLYFELLFEPIGLGVGGLMPLPRGYVCVALPEFQVLAVQPSASCVMPPHNFIGNVQVRSDSRPGVGVGTVADVFLLDWAAQRSPVVARAPVRLCCDVRVRDPGYDACKASGTCQLRSQGQLNASGAASEIVMCAARRRVSCGLWPAAFPCARGAGNPRWGLSA
jgi:hypothetical protein